MVQTSGIHEKINMYPQVDNAIQFIFDKINVIKDHFIVAEIRERETISKILSSNKCRCFYFFVYSCYWCSSWNNKQKVKSKIELVFSYSNEIAKKFLKTMRKRK